MKLQKRHIVMLVILIVDLLLYILARFLPEAVAWYRLHIYWIWTNTLARFSDLFSFSLGEVLIMFFICYLLVGILLLAYLAIRRQRPAKSHKIYAEVLLWMLLWILVTETLNCFVLYQAPKLTVYGKVEKKDYSDEQLQKLYETLVTKANALAPQMDRNKDGQVRYQGDMYAACRSAMQNMGEQYPYLRGYYPTPKKILNSDLMSQQYLEGIYFPFTLESNYNTTMYIMNQPATICHEFSHLKGIILEDEANFFGFAACVNSKDKFLQYSGYLSVLPYVAKDVRTNLPLEIRKKMTQPDAMVQKDGVFLTKDAWSKVEKKAVVPTETARKATDAFLNGNLKSNGVKDGTNSYARVVRLLLEYYN